MAPQGEMIEMAALGHYDAEKSEWLKIECPATQVDGRQTAGDDYPGDNGLDEDCNEDHKAVFWTKGRKVTASVGVALLLSWGVDKLNEDDTTSWPASPGAP
jgi:hypothetical protein